MVPGPFHCDFHEFTEIQTGDSNQPPHVLLLKLPALKDGSAHHHWPLAKRPARYDYEGRKFESHGGRRSHIKEPAIAKTEIMVDIHNIL